LSTLPPITLQYYFNYKSGIN